MGTRIYPTTRNAAIIEILAGVPEGTHKKLTDTILENTTACEKATNDGLSYEDIDTIKHYQRIALDNSPEGRLDGFLTFGWGKFTTQTYEIINGNIPAGEDKDWVWCGGTADVGLIASIMEAQGVNLAALGINAEALEGLSWG